MGQLAVQSLAQGVEPEARLVGVVRGGCAMARGRMAYVEWGAKGAVAEVVGLDRHGRFNRWCSVV